jgi:adenosyl cobinamide kinase/adenosyl cobinamide phosphate guanylyltransferase
MIKALGFTAAGATMPIRIITADDAKARIAHHQAESERAWTDYYGPAAVRKHVSKLHSPGDTYLSRGQRLEFSDLRSEDQKVEWAVEGHEYKCRIV